ncbi:MAG: phospholipase D family protein [Betaproteobacteria bacterium]
MRLFTALIVAILGGCASLPAGFDASKPASRALEEPFQTRLGQAFDAAGTRYGGRSAFRLLPSGIDGLLARLQMADAAERTLDVQYYIYRQDETSNLVSEALLRAADRGVRVRVLIDDHGAVRKNIVLALDAHPLIEVRLFNPFTYRGDNSFLRYIELAVRGPQLKYRMHNKLMVADNAVALTGGRNVGNEYFQASPEFEFGDYDLFSAGPVVRELSRTFDEYWASDLSIPVAAFESHRVTPEQLDRLREALREYRAALKDTEHMQRFATGEPLAAMMDGKGIVRARADVVVDTPRKAVAGPDRVVTSWLQHPAVASAAARTRKEMLLVSPYVVPGDEGMRFLFDLRRRNVSIRMLTNSLEATDVAAAHAGYARYRPALLEGGIAIYEARATLARAGGGTPLASGSSGRFSLHAKALVFDRERVLIGAMNYDKRSLEFNTELGLVVHSPELARQVAQQFDSIANPENSYEVVFDHNGNGDVATPPRLLWRTEQDGKLVELGVEPIRSPWQRATVDFLLALPLDVLIGEADYH